MASDWKSRAVPVTEEESTPTSSSTNGWKSRVLASSPAVTPQEDPSLTEALARGAAQGATLGFSDEIAGGLGAIRDVAQGSVDPTTQLLEAYRRHRDESREANDAAQKAHPTASFGANLAGGLLPALLTGGLGEVGAGASALSKIGSAAELGAGFGAVTGLGDSNADLTQGDTRSALSDIAKGAVGGAAFGGALGTVGQGLGALNKLESVNNVTNAFKLGADGVSLVGKKALQDIGQKGRTLAKDYLIPSLKGEYSSKGQAIASEIEKEGTSPKDVSEWITTIKAKIAKLSDKNPSEAQDKANLTDLIEKFTTPEEIETVAPMEEHPNETKTFTLDQLNNLGDSGNEVPTFTPDQLENLGPESSIPVTQAPPGLSVDDMTDLKRALYDFNNNAASNEGGSVAKFGSEGIREAIANASPSVAEANSEFKPIANATKLLKLKNAGGSFKPENTQVENLNTYISRYKDNTRAGDVARSRINGALDLIRQTNPELADTMQAKINETAQQMYLGRKASNETLFGHGISGIIGGASTKAANVGGQVYGGISKILVGLPKEGLKTVASHISETGGEVGQKLGNVLNEAADRDDIGKNALIFSIMQQPAYRQLLDSYNDQKDVKGNFAK